jgi:hypothetical protein
MISCGFIQISKYIKMLFLNLKYFRTKILLSFLLFGSVVIQVNNNIYGIDKFHDRDGLIVISEEGKPTTKINLKNMISSVSTNPIVLFKMKINVPFEKKEDLRKIYGKLPYDPVSDLYSLEFHYGIHKNNYFQIIANKPLTNILLDMASDKCRQIGMEITQLYVFEHALRQNIIHRAAGVRFEMMRLPNPKSHLEGAMIDPRDTFQFDKYGRYIVVFDWLTGIYLSALDSYIRPNAGFRCIKKQ